MNLSYNNCYDIRSLDVNRIRSKTQRSNDSHIQSLNVVLLSWPNPLMRETISSPNPYKHMITLVVPQTFSLHVWTLQVNQTLSLMTFFFHNFEYYKDIHKKNPYFIRKNNITIYKNLDDFFIEKLIYQNQPNKT